MFLTSTTTRATLILVLFFSLWSCNQQQEPQNQALPENLGDYIYAFTSGNIARTNTISVQFSQAVVDQTKAGQTADKDLLTFSPNIAGSLSWEDAQTLRFTPDEPLPSGTNYQATVRLKSLFDQVSSNLKTFQFDFRTKDQYFDITYNGLQTPNPKQLGIQEFSGQLVTTDLAEEELVEQVLAAKQAGKVLPIRWAHLNGGTVHEFTIEQINRSKNASQVELSWNGQAISVETSGTYPIEVPALGDFKVLSARVIQGDEQHILLTFSDPLKANQDLNGLITISNYNGSYRYLIDGAQVRVYPSSRVVGERTIRIEAGVRNTGNTRMAIAGDWSVSFEDVKPQVRLVGRGVIMPNSEGLIFPFEAVSLNAVEVEIFKIFNNNILQYLQSNNIDEGYDLYRVGRIIMQKRIALSNLNPEASSSRWTRYALDLQDLIDQDPDAIYQVRIGFRPEYATYYCEGQAEAATDNMTLAQTTANGAYKSIMQGWYGINGWYEDYDWSHRDNPCKPAYFNSERFLQRNVIASNLGIVAKQGKDGSFFAALTDIRTTTPIAGATVSVYDFQQQLLQSATTGPDGFASLTLNTEEEPFVLIATKGKEKGYLKVRGGNALSMSRFDVQGVATQKGLKGFLYADRGVWRPGDSVYLNFILEDKTKAVPANLPINFELYDAKGQLYTKRTSTTNVNSIYPLHFNTSPDDATGNWRATVKVGGASFSKTIKVETVKPNRIKIDLGLAGKTLRSTDNPLNTALTATWLHGAPASQLKAQTEIQLDYTRTTFKNYKTYAFDDPARKVRSTQARTIFDGTLDANGQAPIKSDLNGSQLLPGKVNVRFKTRVFEKGGDFSTDQLSTPYSPFPTYAGVELPTDKYGRHQVDVKDKSNLRFVAVDEGGKAVAGRKLSIGVYSVNWRWWWDRGSDNVSRYNSKDHYSAIQTQSVTTNASGEASWPLKVDNWGRYLIRVCDTESGHCSGDYLYAGSPWYGDGDDGRAREAATMLPFSVDKAIYEPGETVQIKIPMGEEGRALITLENGTKVIQSFWATATKGENTFSFEATEEMTPTVYAHVALLQPHAQVKNDLPIRMYGVIPIKVENPDSYLQPEIAMPEVLQPEAPFTLEINEKSGAPMAYTIAVVDEGLLALTRHKTPDPWNTFYAREALGVRTWDVFDKVLGAYGGELERILSIGGDGAEAVNPEDQRANRFKPVVKHLGPFYLKKGKTAKHTIDMPNYVGSVRTMVVAANNGAYGNAEQSTPVRQPVMVLGTLPRVLGPGEQVVLPVNVFAMENNVRAVKVKVEELTGRASIDGGNTLTARFNGTGDQILNFDVNIKEAVGVARFLITAESGSNKAKHEIEIDIRNPNPYVTKVESEVLGPGESWSTGFAPVGMPGTNEGTLEVSSIPPLRLEKHLDYLIRYPYGCLEQTLSGGFPQLYVNQLLEPTDQQRKAIPRNIQATIDRLRNFQLSNGGFAYWPGNANADQWASSYAGHFLLEAKALGYAVPQNMLDNWKQFQKKTARMWNPDWQRYGFYSQGTSNLTQAYRLYTLSLAKQPDFASMNRLREQSGLQSSVRWRLAAAYAVAGKAEVAKALIKNTAINVQDYRELSYTYGSGMRDRAMILETLTILGNQKEAAIQVKTIADQLNANRWWSTHSVSYALLAIGKYVGDGKVADQMSFASTIGGQQKKQGANKPILQMEVPMEETANKKVSLKNTGKNTLFANLILSGQPLAGQEEDLSNDLIMSVMYKDLSGKSIVPSSIPQGTDFIAEVTISHPGQRPDYYRELALNQIFPSGWEILNTRLTNVQNVKQQARPDYQDFRDDRVYTFFDLPASGTKTFVIQLNAAYRGRFYLPAVNCSAMYDNTISATQAGQWVEVVAPNEG
ncbi:MAG: MG2 domain-containing protein [Bacteroidota bacterium]